MSSHRVTIGLGSRDGDRERHITDAIAWLGHLLDEMRASDVYSTEPLSGTGPDYCNAVVSGHCSEEPDELQLRLKGYERQSGRTSERITIDLDLVEVDGEVLRPRDFHAGYFQHGYRQICGHDRD